MKILVVDDEKTIVKGIKFNLENEGYQVDVCYDGETAVDMARRGEYAVILLDLMMPKLDGLGACQQIRQFSTVPIIMLTAKGEEEDKIKGLTAGADDYVTKPFSVPELMARVKTNLRRAPEITPTKELVFEDIRMDLVEKKVFRGENYIHLGPTEFRLLKMLLETPGKVFSRETLLKTVWGDNIYVESRTVDVHIRRLRKSLNDFGPDYIRTVRATGYAIDINPVGDQEEPADN